MGILLAFAVGYVVGAQAGSEGYEEVVTSLKLVRDSEEFKALLSALRSHAESAKMNHRDLLVAESESGICRVLCFSPRHDLALSGMEQKDIRTVVDCWVSQFQELGAPAEIRLVQIFENRGAAMAASNPLTARSGRPQAPRIFRKLSRKRRSRGKREKFVSALRLLRARILTCD